MAIDVGHILDKYQLIEKVGQGGMAVVYRGLDRTLQREVAIKILHTHLADFQEARDRFAREARAVAKLKHENILEIFDYSDGDTETSYIVTEFIEGQTLDGMMRTRPFAYPEVGAMIMVDVCRALAHAHELGVLHRDVKPENIMLRRDGLVKLMDFGIAQMVDTQRLTVTGQLLGSPAYMAPEHVTGDPLDVRTDVFAAGIVLYQLATGELPFQGNNPHELLKRIAEGVYRDPRQLEPLVSKPLGRIIQRALQRDPDARFATAGDMRAALERYLDDECGIPDHRRELTRFFADEAAYEPVLANRLTEFLANRGKQLVREQPVVALECFNRVLTMDPEREDVLAAIDRMSRKRRLWRIAAVFGTSALVAFVILFFLHHTRGGKGQASEALGGVDPTGADARPMATDGLADVAESSASPQEGEALAQVAAADASPPRSDASASPSGHEDHDAARRPVARPRHPQALDASAAPATRVTSRGASVRPFVLKVAQKRSEYRIDQGPWNPVDGQTTLEVLEGAHTLEVQNRACCQNESRRIRADEAGGVISMDLAYMPGSITPRCARKGVIAQINDRPADLGQPNVVIMRSGLGVEKVRVTFIGQRIDTHVLTIRYKENVEVECKLE